MKELWFDLLTLAIGIILITAEISYCMIRDILLGVRKIVDE